MRVGINCLRIWANYKGGVNSFTFGLIDAFARAGSGHDFTIFANPQNIEMFSHYEEIPNFRVAEIRETNHSLLRGIYDRLPVWIRYRPEIIDILNPILEASCEKAIEDEIDVCFVPYCPPTIFPFPSVPTVYSIHDIQQFHYPEFFSPEQLAERAIIFPRCIAHASIVQASSRYMLKDFIAHFPGLDEARVSVIPEGVDIALFSEAISKGNVCAKYNLPEAFLFFPAQLWHHKNHITVFKALKRLKDQGVKIPLVLTGARYEASKGLFDYIELNQLEDQVFYLGLVPFEDIVALYRVARFLITAVLYESSSIPILEAAAAGTPIIASKTPPNVELAEQLKLTLFAPTDDAALANVLRQVWDDEELIREQVSANNEGINYYSWDNSARRYLELFDAIIAGRVGRR